MNYSSTIKFVIAFECGSLGNQLFQYAAIKSVAPSAKIIFIGFRSLKTLLNDIVSFDDSFFGIIFLKLILFFNLNAQRIIKVSGKSKLFSLIKEYKSNNRCYTCLEKGKHFPFIAVLNGFFQDEQNVVTLKPVLLCIKDAILDKAYAWLAENFNTSSNHIYFIHVRRGDYSLWPSLEAPAILPSSWYKSQIAYITKLDAKAQFAILTNDYLHVFEYFNDFNNVVISQESETLDLAIMSLCGGGGVLSASTFSWWGSYYSRQYNPDALFIAPVHWAGWRLREWYPEAIQTSWLNYSEVL